MTQLGIGSDEETRLVDIDGFATLLGVSKNTIRYLRRAGMAPPAQRIGRRLRWREADIRSWLANRVERLP